MTRCYWCNGQDDLGYACERHPGTGRPLANTLDDTEKPASAWVITKDYGYVNGAVVVGVASSLEKARGLVAVRCGRSDCSHMWCYDIDEYVMDVIE